ncbi:MAG TPA: hypothetical protein VJT49_24020 [Amycolatopsis sp.]|uniref:hypothetical protein n=1 Tax=Amycolatopsis sp. TaxID=37632 RepID=UPI002B49607D|nr:hypothetical protein [Amycolatopsis sp.]HKS48120.1 hypothetical protein [Amycolatopsis sp.]
MVEIVLTWIGAVLGIAVLLAMAFGAFVLDFHDRQSDRQARQHREVMPDGGEASPARLGR